MPDNNRAQNDSCITACITHFVTDSATEILPPILIGKGEKAV